MSLTKRPLTRFALLFAVGFALITARAWMSAATEFVHMRWLSGSEHWIAGLGFVVAAGAGWISHLATPAQALAATALATLAHMAIYYLPLAVLLELPLTRYAVADLGTIAGWLFIGYAVALTVALTLRTLRNSGDFA